jgi:hypothetical protein
MMALSNATSVDTTTRPSDEKSGDQENSLSSDATTTTLSTTTTTQVLSARQPAPVQAVNRKILYLTQILSKNNLLTLRSKK